MHDCLYKSTALSALALAGVAFFSLAQPAAATSGMPGGGNPGSPGGGNPGTLPPIGPGGSGIMCQVLEANFYDTNKPIQLQSGYAWGIPYPSGHFQVRAITTTSILAVQYLYYVNVTQNGSLIDYRPYDDGSTHFGSCNLPPGGAEAAADALAQQWSAKYSPYYYGGCPVSKANGC